MELNCYFFSFSFKGKNQGCCNVMAECQHKALQKTIALDIHPKHDDIFCCGIKEPDLPLDTLVAPEDLMVAKFKNFKGTTKDLKNYLEKEKAKK